MTRKLFTVAIMFAISNYSFSQGIGIGTAKPDASAALDITASDKGLLIPRMSTSAINRIAGPANGLIVYDSVVHQLVVNTGTPVKPNWQPVAGATKLAAPVSNSPWNLTGNSGTDPVSHFLGTTDDKPLRFRVNNVQVGELQSASGNIFLGEGAGQNDTSGFSHIAIGRGALKFNTERFQTVAIGDSALLNNQGGLNTAIGSSTLRSNTKGSNNTAVGAIAMSHNTTGFKNTAVGTFALQVNTSGNQNTAIGDLALFNNITGSFNTAVGDQALALNGNERNTAVGANALFLNKTGFNNAALGFKAMEDNSGGAANTALGAFAMSNNTSGISNTAVGHGAMIDNTTGNFNTAVGDNALDGNFNSNSNTAVGFNSGAGSPILGFNNTLIGAETKVTVSGGFNSVALGQLAVCTGSNQVRFGNTSTTSIGGVVGYTNLSDGRYKKNIRESVKGIDFIMKLRPVMYQLDLEGLNAKLYPGRKTDEVSKIAMAENERAVFSGFVAQEVEQAAQATGYNFSGVDKPKNVDDMYGLRYADFVVPMVKAIQEQQKMIEELIKMNSELQKRVLTLENSRN